jgi:hypothetical protein
VSRDEEGGMKGKVVRFTSRKDGTTEIKNSLQRINM